MRRSIHSPSAPMDDSKLIQVILPSAADQAVSSAYLCDTYFEKLRGLTFRRGLPNGKGLFLVESGDTRIGTAIHMWAVFFEIGVVWINAAWIVVDKVLAKPWRLYIPREPARYILEDAPEVLGRIELGQQVKVIPHVRSD